MAIQQRHGEGEERGFEREGEAVAVSEFEGRVLNDESTESGAGDEGNDHGQQVQCVGASGGAECGAEERGRACEMRDRLVLETEQAHDVHDARNKSQSPGPRPNPTWELVDHAHKDVQAGRYRDLFLLRWE